MKSWRSLSVIGLVLIVVPLTIELALVGCLLYLQDLAERQAARAEHAKAIHEAVNQLEKDMFDIVAQSEQTEYTEKELFAGALDGLENDIQVQVRKLKQLANGNAHDIAVINTCETGARESENLLGQARTWYSQDAFHGDNRKFVFKGLRTAMKKLLSQDVLNLAHDEQEIIREAPQKERAVRDQVRVLLTVLAVVPIGLAVSIFLLYSRFVIGRLKMIRENHLRLASGKPLQPMSGWQDEIQELDQQFHSMAEALSNAAMKERAILENARDMIYSLDSHGTFISVSNACTTVLGFQPEELLGSRFVNLIVKDDAQDFLNSLKIIVDGSNEPPSELRIRHKDGRVIDISWSAQWSEKDKSIFCVAHDITERKQAERMRQEVMQMVSHDLKTPLSTVRSFLDMLGTGMFGNLSERGEKLLKLADNSALRMLALIRDLLDIERMEAGMLQLQKKKLLVGDLFEQVEQSVAPSAAEQGIELAIDGDAPMYADPDRIVQILVNLTTNAIKFSPRGSTITLSARELADAVEIVVADQGRGIPENMIDSIFDRFKQVRDSDSREKGGSGLGLAICKALVELHGGAICVRSEENKGSRFIFTIPRVAEVLPERQAPEPATDTPEIVENESLTA